MGTYEIRALALEKAIELAQISSVSNNTSADQVVSDAKKFEAFLKLGN